MLALTLWQPWCGLMAAGIKKIENRPWMPPATLRGQRFALHASKFYDESAEQHIDDLMRAQAYDGIGAYIDKVSWDDHPLRHTWRTAVPHLKTMGAILAVATLVDVVEPNTFAVERARVFSGREDQRRWFFGRCGWVLEDIRAVTPIPYNGRQRLWAVPSHIEQRLLDVVGR